MDPPSCTVLVSVVRTTGAVATVPPPPDAARLPLPPPAAAATTAATAAAARAMAAIGSARLVERSPLTENSAIPAGPVDGLWPVGPAGPTGPTGGGALNTGRGIAA